MRSTLVRSFASVGELDELSTLRPSSMRCARSGAAFWARGAAFWTRGAGNILWARSAAFWRIESVVVGSSADICLEYQRLLCSVALLCSSLLYLTSI